MVSYYLFHGLSKITLIIIINNDNNNNSNNNNNDKNNSSKNSRLKDLTLAKNTIKKEGLKLLDVWMENLRSDFSVLS